MLVGWQEQIDKAEKKYSFEIYNDLKTYAEIDDEVEDKWDCNEVNAKIIEANKLIENMDVIFQLKKLYLMMFHYIIDYYIILHKII